MSSTDSRISVKHLNNIIEKLWRNRHRNSTYNKYFSIWQHLNKFVIQLDSKPKSWEHKTILFFAYLIDRRAQSGTIKSYVSAIKSMLADDDYEWDNNFTLISTLTSACRLKNDTVKTRLPIKCKLLELLLFEIDRSYAEQPYLCILYKTILATGYYRLFRVGELVVSEHDNHTIRARNVHIAQNKFKVLIILYSSKTHSHESRPQKIKITSKLESHNAQTFYCPFSLIWNYLNYRGGYEKDNEYFFIFRDGSKIMHWHVRQLIRSMLQKINIDPTLYDTQSLRIGRVTDMLNYGYSIENIRRAGCWKSNTVFKYLRE